MQCHQCCLQFDVSPLYFELNVSYSLTNLFDFGRLLAVGERGWYEWLDDMYSAINISTFNYTRWEVGNQSMGDVYLQTAHKKEDMIAL